MLLEAHPTGHNEKKSDVLILFSKTYPIGVNIKAGKVGFNQVTRIWLEDFASQVNLSNNTVIAFQKGIDNHRLKRESRVLIENRFRDEVKIELKQKISKILELIFKGLNNDIVKLLVICNRENDKFYIYDMDDVLDILSKSDITFSNKGVVNFGEYITLQRKGGNGDKVHRPKTDPKHPGNQLQFKMKIIDFISNNAPLTII